MTAPTVITGLSQIAGDYDALICDVWGVVHDGVRAYEAAAEALRNFRGRYGRVVMLSNAPRPPAEIAKQFAQFGVPPDSYDAIVTSGGATREELQLRAENGRLSLMHLGPARDVSLFEGLGVDVVGPDRASLVLATGLYDDETETPDHYRETLADLKRRGLTMICANPDAIVPRGGRLVHCAGGLARAYEAIGGKVVYYGKPHQPIYAAALEAAGQPRRPLVIGDGLETDIRGANRAGIDALFIADGAHGAELGALTPEDLAVLFTAKGVSARAAMRALTW